MVLSSPLLSAARGRGGRAARTPQPEPPQAFLLEVPARRTAEPAHCSLHPGDWSILLYRT